MREVVKREEEACSAAPDELWQRCDHEAPWQTWYRRHRGEEEPIPIVTARSFQRRARKTVEINGRGNRT